jgi:hypothetical protein
MRPADVASDPILVDACEKPGLAISRIGGAHQPAIPDERPTIVSASGFKV